MYLLFQLISIVLFISLTTLVHRSLALSFTSGLNPFGYSKPQYRSQLSSIENASYIASFSNPTKVSSHTPPPPSLESNEPVVIKSKWPNMRFMRTFFRRDSVPTANQLNGPPQLMSGANQKSHYILGYNPSNDNLKQLANLPPAIDQAADDSNPTKGLIDWNKVLTKLNKVTSGAKRAQDEFNETTKRASKHPESTSYFSSAPPRSIDDAKKEEEKESNNNLINYFTTFFGSTSGLNENETISSDKEKQSTKSKPKPDVQSPSKVDGLIASALDLFYFNDNLLAKKQIEVLVCDKTMAIINARKNRPNRTVQNCVLFDLEKRSKEAEETVKKLNMTKLEVDFSTMIDIVNQCRRFSDPANKIDAVDPISTIKVKGARPLPPGNSFKASNLTISTNLNMQSDNKSTINLLTGIVSGTLWCGLGDLAKNYTDLGPRKELDICCRAHDHCPIRLRALRYGYGLLNFGISTKSHCQCDRDFFNCLKNVNSKISNTIGHVYFNVLKLQCIEEGPTCVEFDEKNPKKGCLKKKNLMQFKSSDLY